MEGLNSKNKNIKEDQVITCLVEFKPLEPPKILI